MAERLTPMLARWTDAGILDGETAARIQTFERDRKGSRRLHWPIRLALGLGALLLGAGTLLFVSAHWDTLSPQARFSLVVALVAAFHLAAAAVTHRFPAMATALHAVGTVACGAGIYLAGQIFNLNDHWPAALMLWALGAAIGWALLRDGPQLALFALLLPAWLTSEWAVATDAAFFSGGARIATCGIFLLALAYFTATGGDRIDTGRRAVRWLGAIALLPAALALSFASRSDFAFGARAPLPSDLRALGWTVALGLPVAAAVLTRRLRAWPMVLAVFWTLSLINLQPSGLAIYAWWALGAIALVAWGCGKGRSERINMGCAIFAFTVLAFYFSQVMDKLERSASLTGLGILFLAGGWALDRVRRQLVRQTRVAPQGGAA